MPEFGGIPTIQPTSGDLMPSKPVQSVVAVAVVASAVVTGTLIANPGAHAATAGSHQVLMQAIKSLKPGKNDTFKLLNETTRLGGLSGTYAVSSATFSDIGSSGPLEVALLAATCTDSNGYGGVDDIVVPPNQTVHIDYPQALRMPFVSHTPGTWCLFAEVPQTDGIVTVSVVAAKVT
jgi:hypothetical protein